MGSWGDDIGLLYLVLLNAAVLLASWRLARRRSADALDAAGDALLLFYFVQYVSVCLTGVTGAMHALTIGLVALLLSALIALGSWRIRPRDETEVRDEALTGGDDRDEAREAGRAIDGATKLPASRSSSSFAASGASTKDHTVTDARHRACSSSSSREPWPRRRARIVAAGAIVFVLGYIGSLVFHQRNLPVISNDAITYHLPAAAQWLQTGRMGLYEAWYYNPANSYSPLGGSVFLTWLMAPMQSDVIARFVAVGPLIMLMIAMLNLCRRLGVDAGVAALIAATCVLARPFASQAILAKDDLFAAAFFVILVDALSRERLSTRSGPFRAGIALGLLLATKFTVLLSLPLLLLMINRAWTLRRMLSIAGVALVLAGPWYLRNVRLTGNPLYPSDVTIGGVRLLAGMMDVARSRLLTTPRGAWDVFVAGYYGLTRPMASVLIVAWPIAVVMSVIMLRRSRDAMNRVVETTATATTTTTAGPPMTSEAIASPPSSPRARRSGLADPLARTIVLGPLLGIAIFIAVAPYGEMRFAYPSVALLFAALAVVFRPLPWSASVILGGIVMLLAAVTAFRPDLSWMFVASGAALALPAMLITLAPRRIAKRVALAAGGVAAIALGLYAYVYFESYVRQTEADSAVAWSNEGVYGGIGAVWQFVRADAEAADAAASAGPASGDVPGSVAGAGVAGSRIPRGATIAYANTFFTYPLMGYRYDHRVVHVPARRDLERFTELPRLPRKVSGEELVSEIVAELRKNPDRAAWLRRLRESGAQYLVVAKYDPAKPIEKIVPPELAFAEQDPQRFVRVFDNDAGSVFRIAW